MTNTDRIVLMVALSLALSARAYAGDTQRVSEPRGVGEPRTVGELSTSTVLAFGLMPVAAFGPSVAATLRWLDVSMSAEARVLWALGSDPSGVPTMGPKSSVGFGLLSLCRHRDAIFVCNFLQSGVANAELTGDLKPKDDGNLPWILTSGARGGAQWRLWRTVELRSFLELHVVLARPHLKVGTVQKWQASSVAAVAGIGVAFRVTPE
ncbi:hypothetical protein [Sorangium sp. So ce887]|uniref:hypothetical protein n=1 Tax=Sorangium sp. So ce887 TaxID=3133324 RepID=UPI003F63167C